MILRLQPRLWPCRRFDHAIIVRTLDTSSVKGKEEKPPSSRTYDLRVKLRASEGKNCDEQCDDRLSQADIEAKVEVTSARVDRIVKRDRKLSLMKRLKKIDRVGQQDQYNPDLIFKNDTGQIEPHLRQDNSKGIPEENLMEHLPQRVLTPVTMRIPEGLEKTIEVFRDFPDQYPFLRLVYSALLKSSTSVTGLRCHQLRNPRFLLTSGFLLHHSPRTSRTCSKHGSWRRPLRMPSFNKKLS